MNVRRKHILLPREFGVLACLLLTLLSVHEAGGQGTVIFNTSMPNLTVHIWGPSATNPFLALVGLGSNDTSNGNTPFADSAMSLIGAGGSGGHFGYVTTFAQLIGAVGSNQPEGRLFPVGQVTSFRSGGALGCVALITDTLVGFPPFSTTIPADAAAATFEIVAWDNSSGLYPTWAEAAPAWQGAQIAAGHSAPFTVTAIGGDINGPPYLNNGQGTTNGVMSFNLYYPCLSCFYPPSVWTFPATDVTTNSAMLHGQVDPSGRSTSAWFRWGTTTGYGGTTAASDAGSCFCNYFLTTLLTGLTPGTTYHFRTAAANIYGGAIYPGPWPYDGDQSFTTLMLPGTVVRINTGSGSWDVGSSTLSYAGEAGGSHSFILLQSADLTAPLSSWTRVATNNSIPGSFPIPPVGTAAPRYYRVKSE